jgi:SAM-dependent methyltransferase
MPAAELRLTPVAAPWFNLQLARGRLTMANTSHFDDGAAYELFMGRWSRAVSPDFIDWIDPPAAARWLDVGCGSGAFTEHILDTCAPLSMTAIDPSQAQIDYVSTRTLAQRAKFRVADSQALPFSDATFDVVASAFVINFIPDQLRGLKEMRRVAVPGGVVAGCVWDFLGDRGPSQPVRSGMAQVGANVRPQNGVESTSLLALTSLFERAGLEQIEALAIPVALDFRSFDDYWQSQNPPLHPNAQAIAALPDKDRNRLIDLVQASLPARPDGSITCSAYAHAIKGRAPH